MKFHLYRALGLLLVCMTPLLPAQYQLGAIDGASGDLAGASLATMPDVDGDGREDLLVGAPGAGEVRLYSGASLVLLYTISSPLPTFGTAIETIGDVDGDGVTDIAIGAPYAPPAGAVAVHSGATGAALYSLTAASPGADMRFGWALRACGDWDGNGSLDFAASSPLYDAAGQPDVGRIDIFDGPTGALIITLIGTQAHAALGASMDVHPDLSGDGYPDLIAGAPGPFGMIANPQVLPQVDFISGLVIFTDLGVTTQTISLGDVGLTATSSRAFGASVACLGDVNGDGIRDFAATCRAPESLPLVLGGPCLPVISGADLSVLYYAAQGSILPLASIGAGLGYLGVMPIDDVDGDGVDDALFHSVRLLFGHPVSGGYLVTSGIDGHIIHLQGGLFGFSASALDADGDGVPDVAAGAPTDGAAGAVAGRVVLHGLGAAPRQLAILGNPESALPGQSLPEPIVVELTDTMTGAPVAGVAIDVQVTGSASATIASSVTDAQGRVAVEVALLPVAPNQNPGFVVMTATAPGAPVQGVFVALPIRHLSATRTGLQLAVSYIHETEGLPIILAADAPQPGPIATPHGDVFTSVASPGPSFAALDGVGVFGPPNPTLMTSYAQTFFVSPLLAGTGLVLQVYGLDLARPYPRNVFASNPLFLIL